MERIPVSENFNLDEFIDPVSYSSLIKIIGIAQYIREETGLPVTINDWAASGQHKESGFRRMESETGSPTSEHKKLLGAIDVKIDGLTGKEMYDWGVRHAKKLYELGARRFEDPSLTKTWWHIDTKEHGRKGIRVIDLKKETAFIPV